MINVSKIRKKKLSLWIGLLLIVVAFGIWFVSVIEIKSNEIMLSQELGFREFEVYEGELRWWKNVYGTIIIPIAEVLTIFGAVIILSPQLIEFTQRGVSKKDGFPVVKKEDKLMKLNIKQEPIVVLQNLISEESYLKKEKNRLESFRKKFQLKVEQDIENRRDNIKKLRSEIEGLRYICEELSKSYLEKK